LLSCFTMLCVVSCPICLFISLFFSFVFSYHQHGECWLQKTSSEWMELIDRCQTWRWMLTLTLPRAAVVVWQVHHRHQRRHRPRALRVTRHHLLAHIMRWCRVSSHTFLRPSTLYSKDRNVSRFLCNLWLFCLFQHSPLFSRLIVDLAVTSSPLYLLLIWFDLVVKVKVDRFVQHSILRSSPLKRSGMYHSVFTLQTHHTCFHLVSVHQTAPPPPLTVIAAIRLITVALMSMQVKVPVVVC